jgi:hypothetical protein
MANFYKDVIRADARFNSVELINAVDLLEPTMRAKVKSIIDDAKAYGLDFMVFETFRSAARQKKLYDQGATQLKKVGVHNYGLACDIVKSINGQPSWKGDFSLLGRLAQQHGLIWGGDWGRPDLPHSFVDAVHVQWCSISRQAALFRGTWYPVEGYDPRADL